MEQGIVGTLILIVTGLVTYVGLTQSKYQDEYKFDVDKILIDKQYYRLFSSGFVHANWIHFAFNMGALLSFSFSLELVFGIKNFALIYFLSMLGGSLLALFIHRNHGDYTAVGASGAVSGVIASSILLFPHSEIGLVLLPGGITSWVLGLIFITLSILGIKAQSDDIGHEAHLGGIITGIVATVLLQPSTVLKNWWVLVVLLLPVLLFAYLIYSRPDILITNKWRLETPTLKRKGSNKVNVDDLLDKIRATGFDSLTEKEKAMLKKYSDEVL